MLGRFWILRQLLLDKTTQAAQDQRAVGFVAFTLAQLPILRKVENCFRVFLQKIVEFRQNLIIRLAGIGSIQAERDRDVVDEEQCIPELFGIQPVSLQCSHDVVVIPEGFIGEGSFHQALVQTNKKSEAPVTRAIVLTIPAYIDSVGQSVGIIHGFIAPVLRNRTVHSLFGVSVSQRYKMTERQATQNRLLNICIIIELFVSLYIQDGAGITFIHRDSRFNPFR